MMVSCTYWQALDFQDSGLKRGECENKVVNIMQTSTLDTYYVAMYDYHDRDAGQTCGWLTLTKVQILRYTPCALDEWRNSNSEVLYTNSSAIWGLNTILCRYLYGELAFGRLSLRGRNMNLGYSVNFTSAWTLLAWPSAHGGWTSLSFMQLMWRECAQ